MTRARRYVCMYVCMYGFICEDKVPYAREYQQGFAAVDTYVHSE